MREIAFPEDAIYLAPSDRLRAANNVGPFRFGNPANIRLKLIWSHVEVSRSFDNQRWRKAVQPDTSPGRHTGNRRHSTFLATSAPIVSTVSSDNV